MTIIKIIFIISYIISTIIIFAQSEYANDYKVYGAEEWLGMPILICLGPGILALIISAIPAAVFELPEESFIDALIYFFLNIIIPTIIFNIIRPFCRFHLLWKTFNLHEEIIGKMSFTQFKNIFLINPDRWRTSNESLMYDSDRGPRREWKYLSFKSIWDYIKYRSFMRKFNKSTKDLSKYKNQRQKDREFALIINEWIAEIEKYKQENVIEPMEQVRASLK